MNIKIHDNSLKSLRLYFNDKLKGIYPEEELNNLFFIGLEHYLKIDKLHFLADMNSTVSESDILRMRSLAKELINEKPIQYIIKEVEFLNCRIKVNEHVLIPRSETEEIVDAIIKQNLKPKMILDLCTGSGCIAIALKSALKSAEVYAVDNSTEALVMARSNAILNQLDINFFEDDVLDLQKELPSFDLIVSNPPYVMEMEKVLMKKNVLEFEPSQALFVSDQDPLLFYRSIISIAVEKLNAGGWLFMEINEKFGEEITLMMKEAGISDNLLVNKDLNAKDRWVSGQKGK